MRDYNRLGRRRSSNTNMSIGCGTCLAKYCLCVFNFVFFLAGAIALGVGIWMATDRHSFIAVTQIIENKELQIEFGQFTQPTVIEQASYLLIAAGAFVFIVSFIGYCGALRESRCLLTIYGVLLVVILIMEITAGALAAAYKDKAEQETRSFLKRSISKYYASRDKADAVTLMWNYAMAQMECCGVDDYRDFDNTMWKEGNPDKAMPDACCPLEGSIAEFRARDPNCPARRTNTHYSHGCYEKFYMWLTDHMNIIIGVGIGLGVLQLLGIFFAFCLCKSIDDYIK